MAEELIFRAEQAKGTFLPRQHLTFLDSLYCSHHNHSSLDAPE